MRMKTFQTQHFRESLHQISSASSPGRFHRQVQPHHLPHQALQVGTREATAVHPAAAAAVVAEEDGS